MLNKQVINHQKYLSLIYLVIILKFNFIIFVISFQILFILIKSLQDNDSQCNGHGQYDENSQQCVCDLGYKGDTCQDQYCQYDDKHNGFCAGDYAGTCDPVEQQCVCNEDNGFISTGTNCIVDQASYVSTTPDWVLLGFGIASVVLAGVWLAYKFRHGNKLPDQYEKIDEQQQKQTDILQD